MRFACTTPISATVIDTTDHHITPCHAVLGLQTKAVKMLCKHGADAEAQKTNGGRPLHVAADSNQPESARVLLRSCRADPNALLMGDTTPIYLAAQKGYTEVVKVLLSAGEDLHWQGLGCTLRLTAT